MSSLPEEQRFARLIAEHLVFHRLNRGMSKLALAQQAGLDQRTITFIENGVNVPSVVTLFVICRALGIKVSTVIGNAARGKPPALQVEPFPDGRLRDAATTTTRRGKSSRHPGKKRP